MKKRSTGLVLFLFGVAALVVAFVIMHQQNTFAETTARVTDMRVDVSTSSDDSTVYYVYTVEYEVDGTTYSGEISHTANDLEIGDETGIMYNPDKPNTITEPGTGMAKYLFIVSPILIVIGIFLFIAG